MKKLVSSKHLEGVSDLTLTAPIKQGFINAFESVTYESRLRFVLKALFKIRSTAREYSTIQPFVDTSARIRSLIDYRLVILEECDPPRLMLTATFDRPFEPYMRLIWDPLGPLLDVIFCNCDGYVTATEHGFPEYLDWVRRSQKDAGYFYTDSGHSVDDVRYAIEIERLLRENKLNKDLPSITADDPTEVAKAVRKDKPEESTRLGIEALVALYRLTDFYPPDDPDGDGRYLRWAAQHLLQDWTGKLPDAAEHGLQDQLDWFRAPGLPKRKPSIERRLDFDAGDVQGGILKNYGKSATDDQEAKQVWHGALLLMRITDAKRAREYIDGLPIQAGTGKEPADQTYLNIAFTRRGLENIGVAESEIDKFPQEFLEGMEERAGLLGDVRKSHPRYWTLPPRNWKAPANAPPVEISEIDVVLQLRTLQCYPEEYRVGDLKHPLHGRINALGSAEDSGLRLLSVEPMSRANSNPRIDHFGLSDGISQPKATDAAPERIKDEVPRGDILWGYPNGRHDRPQEASPILDNGTFLVVRKLSQDVSRLDDWVKTERKNTGLSREQLIGKALGRDPDGKPLRPGPQEPGFNAFDFDDDKKGMSCPFQSHIRRANPRARRGATHNRLTPRILRRGMSYGPPVKRHEDGSADGVSAKQERGIFFMAYNASIAEQFEVIQRWITGGNSTGVASWQSDPLMGVALENDARVFSFYDDAGNIQRVGIPEPFIKLKWGVYLFVPSMAAIETIVKSPENRQTAAKAAEAAEAQRGEAMIARLLKLAGEGPEGLKAAAAGWKTCLEDFTSKDPGEKGDAGAVWAALRLYHGGALRVPYGMSYHGEAPGDAVLVASKELVMHVFSDPYDRYSMSGQMDRMRKSFGPIFLGMDDSDEYRAKAHEINKKLMSVSEGDAFEVAHRLSRLWLRFVTVTLSGVFGDGIVELDLRRDYITRVLSLACNEWFGIPDGFEGVPPALQILLQGLKPTDICKPINVEAKGWSWEPADQRPPRCPGDYMATSRYCFYPDPHPRVQAYGQEHGQALRKAVRAHFKALRDSKRAPTAPLAKVMRKKFPGPAGDDELARTLIGVMTGFLPPVDGCLRWALYEWLEEKTLWRLQDALLAGGAGPVGYDRANAALREPLERALQKRPSPDMLWRTARTKHRLGGIDIEEGDRVFVGIVSATAEDMAVGVVDTYPVFGGNRAAAPERPHACPAYKFAMGMMLGMVAALLEFGRIEALPAPLLVKLQTPPQGPMPAGPIPSPPAPPGP